MKTVDLSPEMVEAIQSMQRDAEIVIALIEEVSDFVMDVETDGNDKQSLQAYQCVKNLRSIKSYCNAFTTKQ